MATTYDLATVTRIFDGSDGDATKAMYDALQARGPAGEVGVNLFRALKCSLRAKKYRGGAPGRGSYREMAYQRKAYSIDNLCKILGRHAEALGVKWGWKEDPAQARHRWVLYIDVPTGQVSFHSEGRGEGPDYAGEWDGERGASTGRVCRYVADQFGAVRAAAFA